MMPRKCELRPEPPSASEEAGGGPPNPSPQVQVSRQLAGISGTSSDTVMSSQRKTEFNSHRVLADYELSIREAQCSATWKPTG